MFVLRAEPLFRHPFLFASVRAADVLGFRGQYPERYFVFLFLHRTANIQTETIKEKFLKNISVFKTNSLYLHNRKRKQQWKQRNANARSTTTRNTGSSTWKSAAPSQSSPPRNTPCRTRSTTSTSGTVPVSRFTSTRCRTNTNTR